MRQERDTSIRQHPEHRRCEPAVEVRKALKRRSRTGRFAVELGVYRAQRGTLRRAGFKRESHADHLEGVSEEDTCDTGQTTREQTPQRRLLLMRLDQHCPDLLVCDELDGGVGEDAKQRGRMSAEETDGAFGARDVPHGTDRAEP